jgi:hypothetical protein
MKTRVDIRSGLFISYVARQAGSLHRSMRILAKAANVLQSTSCGPYAIGTSACVASGRSNVCSWGKSGRGQRAIRLLMTQN